MDKPLIIAHRGASALAPENTLAAFRRAIEDGAEGIEFDVRLAKDGVPVVFHDSKLNRVGKIEGQVSNFSSAELQTLDVGSWFNFKNPKKADRQFSAETIPTLAQLFDFLADYKGKLYLELKCKQSEVSGLVKAVCKIIRESKFIGQIVLKSFELDAIGQAKNIFPDIRTAALFAPKILNVLNKQIHLIDKAREHHADEISLHYSLATQKLMQSAEKCGFPITIWTANSSVWVKRALDLGINAIITNHPARLLATRHEMLWKSSILV